MKKLALFGLILFGIGIVGTMVTSGSQVSIGSQVSVDEEKTVAVNGIKELDIRLDVGKVRIMEGDDDEFAFRYYGEMSKRAKDNILFDVKEEAQTVKVTVQNNQKKIFQLPFINFDFKSNTNLDITIPKKVLEKIAVKANVSEMLFQQIEVNELIATNDVGKISVNQFTGETAAIRSDVGSVAVENSSGNLDVQTATGKIRVELERFSDDMTLKSDVGVIDVLMKEQPEHGTLDLKSEVGRIKLTGLSNFNDLSGRHIHSSIGKGEPTLKVKTDVGAINIKH